MTSVLSAAVVGHGFPEGTADAPFEYTVTGTLANGDAFSVTQSSGTFDLQPGTYTGVVGKTVAGVTFLSLPSAALVIPVPVVVTLLVPDGTQATLV